MPTGKTYDIVLAEIYQKPSNAVASKGGGLGSIPQAILLDSKIKGSDIRRSVST